MKTHCLITPEGIRVSRTAPPEKPTYPCIVCTAVDCPANNCVISDWEIDYQQWKDQTVLVEDQMAIKVVLEHRNMAYPFQREPIPPVGTILEVELPEWEEVEQWYSIDDKKWIDTTSFTNGKIRFVARFTEPMKEDNAGGEQKEQSPSEEEQEGQEAILDEVTSCFFDMLDGSGVDQIRNYLKENFTITRKGTRKGSTPKEQIPSKPTEEEIEAEARINSERMYPGRSARVQNEGMAFENGFFMGANWVLNYKKK